jgi:hypothetical protein
VRSQLEGDLSSRHCDRPLEVTPAPHRKRHLGLLAEAFVDRFILRKVFNTIAFEREDDVAGGPPTVCA